MPEHQHQRLASELITHLCNTLELDPLLVSAVEIKPVDITVTVLELNENGSKYINADGEVAKHTRTLPFRYEPAVA